jgi:hypothetical protein
MCSRQARAENHLETSSCLHVIKFVAKDMLHPQLNTMSYIIQKPIKYNLYNINTHLIIKYEIWLCSNLRCKCQNKMEKFAKQLHMREEEVEAYSMMPSSKKFIQTWAYFDWMQFLGSALMSRRTLGNVMYYVLLLQGLLIKLQMNQQAHQMKQKMGPQVKYFMKICP